MYVWRCVRCMQTFYETVLELEVGCDEVNNSFSSETGRKSLVLARSRLIDGALPDGSGFQDRESCAAKVWEMTCVS